MVHLIPGHNFVLERSFFRLFHSPPKTGGLSPFAQPRGLSRYSLCDHSGGAQAESRNRTHSISSRGGKDPLTAFVKFYSLRGKDTTRCGANQPKTDTPMPPTPPKLLDRVPETLFPEDGKDLPRLEPALHPLSRQTPSRRDGGTRDRSLPFLPGDPTTGGRGNAESGVQRPSLPVPQRVGDEAGRTDRGHSGETTAVAANRLESTRSGTSHRRDDRDAPARRPLVPPVPEAVYIPYPFLSRVRIIPPGIQLNQRTR
jgi:hypothetical protein